MVHIVHKELSYTLSGILFGVHNEVGRFASEKQICDAIEIRLKQHGLSYRREFVLPSAHAGERMGRHRVDFIIEDKIILEIKMRRQLRQEDYDQVLRYLKVLNLALGILVNFRDERLHPRRVLNGAGKE